MRDVEILSDEYEVKESFFKITKKSQVPAQFLKQFFFFISNLRGAEGVICHFAGYSSLLPSLLCKLFRKPCLIIVAGNDGSKFPDFNYGNYTRKLLGTVTGRSLQYASQILPVHDSLYYQDYSYYEGGAPAQGYSFFYPKAAKVPHTAVYYGYDPKVFKLIGKERKPNTFLTMGNLSETYSFKRKGFDIIIELARKHADFQFTMAGWDGKTPIDVPQNVTLLPYLPQKEVIELFNSHQFYFQLSIMEGFPNALAEAMLCGCIPIGSNVSGIPHIMGDIGYLLHHRDMTELEAIINAIQQASSSDLFQKTNAARKRIVEHFPIERRKNEILRLLKTDPRRKKIRTT